MNWQLEIAKLEFAFIAVDAIPDLACIALSEGMDSYSIRILAGINKTDFDDIRKYLGKVANELQIKYPTREESAWILIRYYFEQIIGSHIEPHRGLHTIIWQIYNQTGWRNRDQKSVGDYIGIQNLYGLCDTYDDFLETFVSLDKQSSWDKSKTNRQILTELDQSILAAVIEFKLNNPDKF